MPIVHLNNIDLYYEEYGKRIPHRTDFWFIKKRLKVCNYYSRFFNKQMTNLSPDDN